LAVVNIVDVSSRDLSEEQLWGCNIDFPVPESRMGSQAFDIVGWVLGRRLPAIAVEIVSESTVLRRVPVDIRRPDIAAAFPEVPGAELSGFQNTLDVSEIGPAFDLFVQAVFEDGRRLQIGVIRGRHRSMRGEVEVVEVSTVPAGLSALLWGCNIDLPVPESQTDVYAISVEGWALGRSSPAVAVEFSNERTMFCRIPLGIRRPDIADQYPAVPEATKSGFRATVNVLGLPLEFEVLVKVVLQDENRVPIGVIRGRRHPISSDFQPRLHPLMLTTLGRTGSTWVMQLLGQHPQIVAYRPFEYEPRVSSYWMQVLKTLSEPASYLQALAADLSDDYWWLGSKRLPSVPPVPDAQIQQWLGRYQIEELVAFCQNRIREFYEQVALIQGKTKPIYFAEKYLSGYDSSGYDVQAMIEELYPQSREIVLVRDFRDVYCSIQSFNAKQGFAGFGRERVNSDKEYLQQLRLQALYALRSWKRYSGRAHLLRYEDLVLRPNETLSALLEYLDLDSAPSKVEGMIQRSSDETLDMQEHRTIPDPQQSIGRWRRDLDPSLQDVCQEAFGDILREFGYEE
jgi:Sulfotransferase family